MEQAAHHPLGPSAAHRWLNCPGSVRLTAEIEDEQSMYSAEGHAAHYVSELCRKKGQPASEYLGYTDENMVWPDGKPIVCDQEMVDGVQYFLDYVNALPGEPFYELRVSYSQWIPGAFGTADDIRIAEPVCYVSDFKYGKGVQEWAEKNAQLMLYGAGTLEELEHLYEIEEFRLAIIQPRLDHVSEWSLTRKELLRWLRDVAAPGARETEEEHAEVKPGPWCQFCKIKLRCRERANWVLGVTDEAGPLFDNAELALVLPHLDAIRGWCNDMEQLAMSEIQKGSRVGDYKLVEGRSNRSWRDEEKAIRALRNTYKLKVNDIQPRKLLSPPQLEKLVGKKHPIFQGDRYVYKPQGRPKLAPGSDSRPSFEIDPQKEFDSVEFAESDNA